MHKLIVAFALAMGVPAAAQAQEAAPPAKSYQLSKVLLDTTSREIQGKLKGGTLCVFPSKIDPLLVDEKKTQDHERYDGVFAEEMAKRGFTVVAESQNMFASASDNKGDYLVGATLRPDTMNICSSVNGVKGQILIDVEWQIFDRTSQKIVETVTTRGTGDVPKFDRNGYDVLWNRAFASSLNALIDQGTVGKYAGVEAKPREIPAAAAAPAATQ
jgi:hypothetical protein